VTTVGGQAVLEAPLAVPTLRTGELCSHVRLK
jgi:hypothetical protein